MLRFTEWGLANYSFEERGQQPFDGSYRPGSTYEFPQRMQAREVKSTNWQPMIVSCHECGPGEQMDRRGRTTSSGLNNRALPLVKAVLRCMVNLTAVGGLVIRDINAEQPRRSWSNCDVDHCDTLGPSLQCIAEGVFGIHPHMMRKLVEIQPGFPAGWDHAQIELRDIGYSFRRRGNTDMFSVTTSKPTVKRMRLVMRGDGAIVKADGQAAARFRVVPGICHPFLEVESPEGKSAEFSVTYNADPLPSLEHAQVAGRHRTFAIACRGGNIVELKDPQGIFGTARIDGSRFSATVVGGLGQHTAFLRVKGKATEFWLPVDIEIRHPLELIDVRLSNDARMANFAVRNNAGQSAEVRGLSSAPENRFLSMPRSVPAIYRGLSRYGWTTPMDWCRA